MSTCLKDNPIEKIERVLISGEKMQERARELGRKISEDFAGKELVVIGVLKGSVIFLSDLIRNISIPLTLDFISVSSYGDAACSSGVVTLRKDVGCNISDKDLLIVEDIIDTGLTLKYIKDLFTARKARSVSICCALDKPSRRNSNADIKIDYVGAQIPDEFVVGYGLDYSERYRNLPDVCVLNIVN